MPRPKTFVKSTSTISKEQAEYFAYGSDARPLDWLTIRDTITSVPYTALTRLSRGADYSSQEPYFNILLSPKPLTEQEIRALELIPLERLP